jgi:Lrp/AsnC family transcriptional regulator, leucine-responsive regulatory protein
MHQFDAIDPQLLAFLQSNDRAPLAELGGAIGVPISTLNDRLKRLMRQGVIAGFHARLSPEAVGLDLLAFVFVGWNDPKTEAAFLEKVEASPDILECHHVTGVWNYLLKVRLKNTKELEQFLANTIKSIEGIQRTETVIALSTAKETSALRIP